MQEKTILGVTLRRRIIQTVNGMGRGTRISVTFKGTRAYTDGRNIVLPAIRDLAEIKYRTARALIGYAIHEVAHIRLTDFGSIVRAIESGRMGQDKLIKSFENAIEDYRIERDISREFPGSVEDLTLLRNLVHPNPTKLPGKWYADPRACGPLALTWTGSQLNGFVIPGVQPTLDLIPDQVRALIDDWTVRMKDVQSTDEVVDLAIAIAQEARDYAQANSRPQPQQGDEADEEKSQSGQDDPEDQIDANDGQEDGSEDRSTADSDTGDQPSDKGPEPDSPSEESDGEAGAPDEADQGSDGEDDATSGDDAGEDHGDGGSQSGGDEAPSDQSGTSKKAGPNGAPNDDPNFSTGAASSKGEGNGAPAKDGNGSIDLNAGISDLDSDEDQSGAERAGNQEGATGDIAGDDASDGDEFDADPFDGALEPGAALDDLLDDIAEAVANGLGSEEPQPTDGEVDPSDVMADVKESNAAAPNYTSEDAPTSEPAADETDEQQNAGKRDATAHHYGDRRFIPVDPVASDANALPALLAAASGVIATTARTIRRLLMAEEQKGVLRNRRSGAFDIRNISNIVRNTGNVYKTAWQRPAPETHLTLLVDFSGSMNFDPTASMSAIINGQVDKARRPLNLAMTGALAIQEATKNTSIETSIYGYQGGSPWVYLYAFKEGKQSRMATHRKMGAFDGLELGCTPTGEAMVAAAELLESVPHKRRILLVLTDGDADDMALCKSVVPVIEGRGVEVVAIGINKTSVRNWCNNTHVITDVAQLPEALLAVIDPRAHKKTRRRAA